MHLNHPLSSGFCKTHQNEQYFFQVINSIIQRLWRGDHFILVTVIFRGQWVMILQRETFTREIFASSTSHAKSCEMLTAEKIDYVIISSGAGEIGDTNVQVSSIVQSFKPIYNNESENHRIYSVNENCSFL